MNTLKFSIENEESIFEVYCNFIYIFIERACVPVFAQTKGNNNDALRDQLNTVFKYQHLDYDDGERVYDAVRGITDFVREERENLPLDSDVDYDSDALDSDLGEVEDPDLSEFGHEFQNKKKGYKTEDDV